MHLLNGGRAAGLAAVVAVVVLRSRWQQLAGWLSCVKEEGKHDKAGHVGGKRSNARREDGDYAFSCFVSHFKLEAATEARYGSAR